MSEINRNFRASYYDKVGFRGVEEKKSLEILINEKPIDRAKLSKFCLRFTLPSIYRELVWKVLLDVISINTETHAFIMHQRILHYEDLYLSLKMTQKINLLSPKPVVHTLMYLMIEDVILFEEEHQLDTLYGKNLIAIASVFCKFYHCEFTSYWLFKKFLIHQRRFNISLKYLKEQLDIILKKEDIALYEHLKQINILEILPSEMWFGRYFAGILHYTSLARVFDKIIGGSFKILPYIGSSILMMMRHPLLELNSPGEILEVIKMIPEATSDVIVNKAFDLCFN